MHFPDAPGNNRKHCSVPGGCRMGTPITAALGSSAYRARMRSAGLCTRKHAHISVLVIVVKALLYRIVHRAYTIYQYIISQHMQIILKITFNKCRGYCCVHIVMATYVSTRFISSRSVLVWRFGVVYLRFPMQLSAFTILSE